MMKFFLPASRSGQSGFGLLEVLISVLILAVGLLGLAALQASSLRVGGSATWRSQAVMAAHDMMERVRANQLDVADYNSASAGVACNPGFSPNAASSVAVNDLNAWRNQLACMLPGGQGGVVVNANQVTVSVTWDDSRGTEPLQVFSFTSQVL